MTKRQDGRKLEQFRWSLQQCDPSNGMLTVNGNLVDSLAKGTLQLWLMKVNGSQHGVVSDGS